MDKTTHETIGFANEVAYLPKGSTIETILTREMPEAQLVTAVFGIIYSQGEFLFTLPKDTIMHHELDIPGGHIEKSEKPEEGLKREILEETGVSVENLELEAYQKVVIINPSKDYKYPVPTSYMLFYVGILKDRQMTNNTGVWLSLESARQNSWVKENRVLFESLYQLARYKNNEFHPSLLDVYDENGEPAGEVASYDRVHRQGLWHRSVRVWLLDSQNRFLVQRRGPNVHTYPNLYESTAGGHIDLGHDNIQTAIKELHEETGIEVDGEELIYVGTLTDQFVDLDGTIINNSFDDIYLIRRDINENELPKKNTEVSGFALFDAKEFLERGIAGDPKIIPRVHEFEFLYDYLFPVQHKKHFNMSDQ